MIAATLLSLAIAWAIGYLAMRLLGEDRLLSALALGAAAGVIITSVTHAAALAMQLSGRWAVTILDALVLAGLLMMWRRRRVPMEPFGEARLIAALGPGLLATVALAVSIYAAHPRGQYDAWAQWNMKAAMMSRNPAQWTNLFDPGGAIVHMDYPLLLPLSVARLWRAAGAEWTGAPALLGAGLLMMTILLAADTVARRTNALIGAAAGCALMSTPFLITQGSYQMADVPLALMLLGAVSMLSLAAEAPTWRGGPVVAAGLLAGGAAWTKNEGLVMVIAVALAATVAAPHGRRRRTVLLLLGAALPLVLLNVAVKAAGVVGTDLFAQRDSGEMMEKIFDFDRHRMIFAELWHWLSTLWCLPVLGALAIYAAASGLNRDAPRATVAAGVVFAIMAIAYYAIYLITPLDLRWHLLTSLGRVMLHLWPVAVVGLLLAVRPPTVRHVIPSST